ncbi:MAG TPA: transglutaminase family protein [Tepidisphaeraceae bacterium]|nr:transglutaminase family protein [Tepidisphaeraceae bacterium]
MLLKITHTTDLTYSDMISESVMELRMVPRQEQDQHRLSFNLAIGPSTNSLSYFDWLGNTVHAFTINAFHQQIRIVATSVVETDRPPRDLAELPDTWPIAPRPEDYALQDFLCFGGPVVDSPQLRAVVESLQPRDGEPLGGLAQRMVDLINQRFTYQPGVTTAASPITEMLQHGYGVCQDFTHLMIGMARALKLPARYVSGYLHAQSDQLRGFSQTHAWVELYFPSHGWIGFDPANRVMAGEHFVKAGIGRDFRDVPPNKGVYRGTAVETMRVQVQSEPLPVVPPELSVDRVRTLQIPTFASGRPPHKERVVQQQEHQQQQQQQQ